MADVTISSTVTGLKWQGGTTPPTLIIEAAGPFLTAGGVPVNNGGGPFRAEYATTINGSGYVVVPAVTLPSTEDSSVPTVTYFAYFQKSNIYDPASRMPFSVFGLGRGFRVPESPTTTTWEEIDANMGVALPITPGDRQVGNLDASGDITAAGDLNVGDDLTVGDDIDFGGVITGNAAGLSNLPGTPDGPQYESLQADASLWAKYQADGGGIGRFDIFRGDPGSSVFGVNASGEVDEFTPSAEVRALLGTAGVFDPLAYGAVCDGVTNSTAALLAALAALEANGGGTLIIPESEDGMLVGGAAVADYIVNLTVPCTVRGSGSRSVLLVHASTPATTDVFRISPPATLTPEFGLVFPEAGSGYIFRDFYVRAASGTPARHGIHVELASGSFFSQSLFTGLFFDDLGGRSLYFNNGAMNTDGIFMNTVERCYLSGGIYAIGFGDSNRIVNNRFWGDGNSANRIAIEIASFIAGAGNLLVAGNNITQKGGVSISGGTGHLVVGNFVELYRAGSTGTDGAVFSIKGTAKQVSVENNLFGSLNGNTINGVRVGGSTSSVSVNNDYKNLPPGVNTVVIDAGAAGAWIGAQGSLDGGGSGVLNNSDSAQGPVFSALNGRATRVGSLNATALLNSEIATGFNSSAANIAILEINRNAATSGDTGFAALVGAATQSGINNALFSIYAANLAAAGTDKRLGIIAAATDGATNTGRWDFYTMNAGVLAIRFKIKKNTVSMMGLPVYANNAAALAGGLVAGDCYRTGGDPDPVCVVH